MPHSLGPKEVIIDQKLKVFVYLDSNDSLLANAFSANFFRARLPLGVIISFPNAIDKL